MSGRDGVDAAASKPSPAQPGSGAAIWDLGGPGGFPAGRGPRSETTTTDRAAPQRRARRVSTYAHHERMLKRWGRYGQSTKPPTTGESAPPEPAASCPPATSNASPATHAPTSSPSNSAAAPAPTSPHPPTHCHSPTSRTQSHRPTPSGPGGAHSSSSAAAQRRPAGPRCPWSTTNPPPQATRVTTHCWPRPPRTSQPATAHPAHCGRSPRTDSCSRRGGSATFLRTDVRIRRYTSGVPAARHLRRSLRHQPRRKDTHA